MNLGCLQQFSLSKPWDCIERGTAACDVNIEAHINPPFLNLPLTLMLPKPLHTSFTRSTSLPLFVVISLHKVISVLTMEKVTFHPSSTC